MTKTGSVIPMDRIEEKKVVCQFAKSGYKKRKKRQKKNVLSISSVPYPRGVFTSKAKGM